MIEERQIQIGTGISIAISTYSPNKTVAQCIANWCCARWRVELDDPNDSDAEIARGCLPAKFRHLMPEKIAVPRTQMTRA
jgi:hypothetical protein